MSTVVVSTEEKKQRAAKLRELHQPVFDRLGISNAVFLPKMAYKPIGKAELYVSFFNSEISGGKDVYLEFTDRQNVSEDPKRTLYKWRFNPHYETEYELTEPSPGTGHVRYLVPVGELIVIEMPPEKVKLSTKDVKNAELNLNLPDPNMDSPLEQATLRDLTAILLKTPCSTKKWLNDIITNLK